MEAYRAFSDYPQDSKARTPSWQDREPVKMVRENLASIQRRFHDEMLVQKTAA